MRVALVGLGWVASAVWLPRLEADPAYDVVAAVDPGRAGERLAFRDTSLAVRAGTADLGGADVAFVLSPNHTHRDVAASLLGQGVPVFLEKPACRDRAELDELLAAATGSGSALVMSAAARYRADVGTVVDLARSGRLGRVREVDVSWVRARGVPGTGTWFTSRRRAGGGALIDLGWHLLEVARLLVGEPAVRAVTAVASGDFVGRADADSPWKDGPHEPVAPPDVEDGLRAYAALDGGVALHLRAAWASHEPVDTTVVAVTGTAARVVLTTTFGFSPNRVEHPTCVLLDGDGAHDVPLPAARVGDEYAAQLAALPAALRDPGATARTAAEARWILDVIGACYASAEATSG